jgi:hypothetical protein
MPRPRIVDHGGDLAQLGEVLPCVGHPADLPNQLPLRGDNDFGGQDRDPELLACVREVVHVDANGDERGLQRGRNFRLRKDFLFHLPAWLAPVGPEVDEHQTIRLRSQSFGRLQTHLPTDRLLSGGRARQSADD